MGRATLEELTHQVQTSLRLEATTVVRGRIRKIQSHQLQNGSIEQWMTVSDQTGSYTVALTEQALDQLISCIDPLAPTPNVAEYQAMMDHPMYNPNVHELLLKRSESYYFIPAYTFVVMRCRYKPVAQEVQLCRARRKIRSWSNYPGTMGWFSLDLECIGLELTRDHEDDPSVTDWCKEGRAMLSDIHLMLQGSPPEASIPALHCPGWRMKERAAIGVFYENEGASFPPSPRYSDEYASDGSDVCGFSGW